MKIKKSLLQEIVRESLKAHGVEIMPQRTKEKQKEKIQKPNPLRPPKDAPRTAPKGVYREEKKSKTLDKIVDRYESLKEDFGVSPTMMNILLESIIGDLEQKYVGTGEEGEEQKISQEAFEAAVEAVKGNPNYATWLVRNVAEKNILEEDIYKFEEYFDIFTNKEQKAHIPKKDIFQYKGKEGVQEFIKAVIAARERKVDLGTETGDNLVSSKDIARLKKVGINLLGMVDGYQAFEIPTTVANSEETWKVYREVLGRCKGRDQGAKIDICTIGNFSYFQSYVKQGDTYVFFNLNDPKSPYQFTYEANMFKDKDDNDVI